MINVFLNATNESLKSIWRTFFLYFCCNLTNFKQQTFTLQFIQHDSFYFCLFFRRNKCFLFSRIFFLSIQKLFKSSFPSFISGLLYWRVDLRDHHHEINAIQEMIPTFFFSIFTDFCVISTSAFSQFCHGTPQIN